MVKDQRLMDISLTSPKIAREKEIQRSVKLKLLPNAHCGTSIIRIFSSVVICSIFVADSPRASNVSSLSERDMDQGSAEAHKKLSHRTKKGTSAKLTIFRGHEPVPELELLVR